MLSNLYEMIVNSFLDFRLFDAIDIFLTTLLIYWFLTIIKGTRAIYMLIGLAIGLVMVWVTSLQAIEMISLNWVLTNFFRHLPLIVIVLFQAEIRKALVHLGKSPFFTKTVSYAEEAMIDEVVQAVAALASKKIGALVVIEREGDLTYLVETTGIPIDSMVSKELIESVFNPASPIHDGAIIIQKGRISKVGCFLPMTLSTRISFELGSRHRAAIGLSEEVDAVVIVVSEERGTTSLVHREHLEKDLGNKALKNRLEDILAPSSMKRKPIKWIHWLKKWAAE